MRTRPKSALSAACALAFVWAFALLLAPRPMPVAADRWVSLTGTDAANCGLNAASACATVTHAAYVATVNDSAIRVLPGLYAGNWSQCSANGTVISGAKPLAIVAHGTSPTNPVVIDCEHSGRFVTFRDTSAVLAGFTIRNGNALYAGAVLAVLSFQPLDGGFQHVLTDMRFEGNTAFCDTPTPDPDVSGSLAGAVLIQYRVSANIRLAGHKCVRCVFVRNYLPRVNDVHIRAMAGAMVVRVVTNPGPNFGGANIYDMTYEWDACVFQANSHSLTQQFSELSVSAHQLALHADSSAANNKQTVAFTGCVFRDAPMLLQFLPAGSVSSPADLTHSGGVAVHFQSRSAYNQFITTTFVGCTFANNTALGAIVTGSMSIANHAAVTFHAFMDNRFLDTHFLDSTFNTGIEGFGGLANGGPALIAGGLAVAYSSSITSNTNCSIRVTGTSFNGVSGGGNVLCLPSTGAPPCAVTGAGAIAVHWQATSTHLLNSLAVTDSTFTGVNGGNTVQSQPYVNGAGVIAVTEITSETTSLSVSLFNSNFTSCGGANGILSPQPGGLLAGSNIVSWLVAAQDQTAAALLVSGCNFVGGSGSAAMGGTPISIASGGAITILFAAIKSEQHTFTLTNSYFSSITSGATNTFPSLTLGVNFVGSGALAVMFTGNTATAMAMSTPVSATAASLIGFQISGCLFDSLTGPQLVSTTQVQTVAAAIAVQYCMSDQGGVSGSTLGTTDSNAIAITGSVVSNSACGVVGNRPSSASSSAGAVAVLYVASGGNTNHQHTLTGTTFRNNSNYNQLLSAGAVMISVTGMLSARNVHTFTNCLFDSNRGSDGGAISVVSVTQSISQTVINGCTFRSNAALCDTKTCCCSGGAAAFTGAAFAIAGSTFENNHATYSGGALLLDVDATGSVMDSSFTNDTAETFGDEVHSRSSGTVLVNQTIFNLAGTDSMNDSTVAIAVLHNLITFGSDTHLICPVGNTVYSSRNFYGCQFCAIKSYLVNSGVWVDPPKQNLYTPCLVCPYGADCNGGSNVNTSSGYWAMQVDDGSLVTTACPDGYCCLGAAQCRWFEACSSTNRAGRLCGKCLDGYSETLGSTQCRITPDCVDGIWFFPLFMCLATVLFAYFFLSSPKSSGLAAIIGLFYQCVGLLFAQSAASDIFAETVTSLFDFRFNSGGRTGVCAFPGMNALQKQWFWLATPLLVLVPLLVCYLWYALRDRFCDTEDPNASSSGSSGAGSALLGPYDSAASHFNTVSSFGTNSLLHPGLTTAMKVPATNSGAAASTVDSKSASSAASSLVPTSALAGVAGAGAAHSLRMSPLTVPVDSSSAAPIPVGSFPGLEPPMRGIKPPSGMIGSGSSDGSGTTIGRAYHSNPRLKGVENSSSGETTVEANARRALTSISSTSTGITVTRMRVKHLKTRGPHFAAALTNICIYTYSSVLKAVFVLLHCVPIAGLNGTYLFEAAETECYQPWQWALLPFLVVLCALPVAILVWAIYKPHNVVPLNAAKRAMMDVLFSPYAAHALPWNAVLLLQRFILITFDTFLVVANTRVQVLTSICVGFLVLHVTVQPFHRSTMNRFQLLCLSLLVLIGVSNCSAASLLTSGYPSNDVMTRAFSILGALQSTMLAIPFAIAFVLFVRMKCRACDQQKKNEAAADAAGAILRSSHNKLAASQHAGPSSSAAFAPALHVPVVSSAVANGGSGNATTPRATATYSAAPTSAAAAAAAGGGGGSNSSPRSRVGTINAESKTADSLRTPLILNSV